MSIVLRGLTWDDPRGYGPLEAADQAFAASTPGPQMTVRWDIQPLSGFESAPLEHLAERFDLLVIDHPHIGEAVDRGCLAQVGRLPDEFVGLVRESYSWQGEQWAVPVDAACHVAAWRSGVPEDSLPTMLAGVYDAAERSLRVAIPLAGVHSLMALLTLLASGGSPIEDCVEGLPDDDAIAVAATRLRWLLDVGLGESLNWDPIQALDAVAAGRCDYVPFTFGYAHYQRRGVHFGAAPAVNADHPLRPVLGGTGLAVSAHCSHWELALLYARFMGSAGVQSELWPEHGGQPAHAAAWQRLAVDDAFYRQTRSSIESSYVRPRFAGWNRFQIEAGKVINGWLRQAGASSEVLCGQLKELWRAAWSSQNISPVWLDRFV